MQRIEFEFAFYVMVNLQTSVNLSTYEKRKPTTEKTRAFCQAEMVRVQSCIGEEEGNVLRKVCLKPTNIHQIWKGT